MEVITTFLKHYKGGTAMKSYDYDAVFYDGEIYCNECCPVNLNDEDVMPIFADSEWESYPVCCECGYEHDYMNIIDEEFKLDRSYEGFVVSSDTLKTGDLIDSFMYFLENVNYPGMKELEQELEDCTSEQDEDWFLNETLFDAMEDIAPPGCFFGAHPGDGACFGFWTEEKEVSAL